MANLTVLLLLITISWVLAAQHSTIMCPENPKEQSFLPHQFEKSNFFFCGKRADSNPVTILRCQRWMFFDPSSQGLCSANSENHPNIENFPIIEIGKVPLSDSRCPADNDPDYVVHVPHETDCNLFYKCDWGVAILFRCPAGLHFNPEKEVCDYPDAAGCITSGCKLNPIPECPKWGSLLKPIKLPHENNCRKYYICILGKAVLQKCPKFKHFNPKTLTCQLKLIAGCKKNDKPEESEESVESKESNESKSTGTDSHSKESKETSESEREESKDSSKSKSKESSNETNSKESKESQESEEDSEEDLIEC